MSFSGSPTVNAPVCTGYFHIEKALSIRTKIRIAMAYGLSTNLTKANGYFLDIGEVHVNAPTNDDGRKAWPSVDIIWDTETYTNRISGENSLGGYNKVGRIFIKGVLFADANKIVSEEIVLMREHFIADIERYFGINYIIPDSNGAGTVQNCILISNDIFGMDVNAPKGEVIMPLEVYYRIELTDPTQDF